jgi:hypothetical protein
MTSKKKKKKKSVDSTESHFTVAVPKIFPTVAL